MVELIGCIGPKFTLLSTKGPAGGHRFAHTLAQSIIREAVDPIAKTGALRKPDWDLGIFYTCDVDSKNKPLGSIAVVIAGAPRPHDVALRGQNGRADQIRQRSEESLRRFTGCRSQKRGNSGQATRCWLARAARPAF